MMWLFLLSVLFLIPISWLLLKWLEARRKQQERDRQLREKSELSTLYQSIAKDLKSRPVRAKPSATPSQAKTPPPALDEWRQLWDPAANDESKQSQQTKPVRQLPLPEYHWLKKNHRQNIQTARLVLNQLRAQIHSAEPDHALKIVIGSLRRVNPFVFEELLLHCFKDAGYQVVRNSRYTGDDGIDGRIYRDGKLYYVQAKRYAGLIDAAHLRAFEQTITNSYGVEGGFFVHTGRTGDTAKAISRQQGQVTLLSGMRLVDFVLARGVAAIAQQQIAVAEADDPW